MMSSLRLGIAFAGMTLAALVCLQLLAVFKSENQPPASFTRNFNQWKSRASKVSADDVFLVGAGKADITGYFHALNPRFALHC